MNSRSRCGVVGVAVLFLSFFWAGKAPAVDHFLTIGGGNNPTSNQVSLEKNVLLFQQFLAERYPNGAPHSIFFADGESSGRDLQFSDPNYQIPKPNQLLARLTRDEDGLHYQYRSHQVPGAHGPSTRAAIERWFQEVGRKLTPQDRLLIYFTGHGGKSADPGNTVIYLWNFEQFTMCEFVGLLDQVPAEVPVVMVMVQCYAGGFANTIFNEGKSAKGATSANRCGFFATVEDQPAAGCTPDIEEDNYKEYSSYFWAAMRGESRTGVPVATPDWNLDGQVGFDEAHAYALLTSDTIDVSIKTSDALLRSISRNTGDQPGLVTADAPYQHLIAVATPVDRAVLDGLSEQLGLAAPQRGRQARELAEHVQSEIKELKARAKKLGGEYDGRRRQILDECKVLWPELSNRWNPKAFELLQREGAELVTTVEKLPEYSPFLQLHEELETLAMRKLDLERKWAKCQRLLRVIDNITLAANVRVVATPEAQARYQRLVEAEGQALGGPERR